MVRLQRRGVRPPAAWDGLVVLAFGTPQRYEQFFAQAVAFEALPLDDPRRRAGFAVFAPRALLSKKRRGVACGRDFPPLWRAQEAVKQALSRMSGGHCAYCQSPAGADQHAAVEHYRPKALFPTLAYDWANYFYSCELCNGTKLDHWHADGYVRPDEGRPEARFRFGHDGGVACVPGCNDAQRTIEDFGLGRPGLAKARQIAIGPHQGTMRDLRDRAQKKPGLRPMLHEMARDLLARIVPLSPYSVAIRQNLRRVWNEAFPDEKI